MDDPSYIAFYGMLQVSSRLLELVGDRMERDSGLSPAWFEVLAQLYKGPVRMGELADSLTLSRGGATRLVARMEEAGLVEREIPKEDRRATFARITDKGRTVLEAAKPLHFAAVDEIFSRYLTAEQAAVLRDVNARVLLGNGLRCGPVTDGYEPAE